MDMWSGEGWMRTPESVVVAKGQTWASSLHLYPNNYDFPVINMTTQANLPIEDLAPLMTGIYVSCRSKPQGPVVLLIMLGTTERVAFCYYSARLLGVLGPCTRPQARVVRAIVYPSVNRG